MRKQASETDLGVDGSPPGPSTPRIPLAPRLASGYPPSEPLNRSLANPFRVSEEGEPLCHPDPDFWNGNRDGIAPGDRVRVVSAGGRLRAAATAAALLVPLLVACRLEPNASGFGTHQQLGLPPCTMVALFGVRCPTCGMTTSWAALVHGRLLEGLAANVGGVLLAIAAIASVVALTSTACLGRRPRWFPDTNGLAWGGTVIALITLVDWLIRLLLR